ncbi:MAG: DUF4125 family protein [Lachnospiraceae bacterium]|nr:DUF4125 family protein [Lachnospiraceae bacterium]
MNTEEEIIKREWDFFQQAHNEGGRAACQDDWETFRIMRESQFDPWPEAVRESYLQDLRKAQEAGWNMVAEKYARMMEFTAPEAYSGIAGQLPACSPDKRALTDAIVAIQVGWMEEFADEYPHLSGNARRIHTSEDTAWETSAETYLRGELLTYSERTLQLYGQFVSQLAKKGENLNRMIMERTAEKYGYRSLEDAESRCKMPEAD